MPDDVELLRQYAEHGSQEAFAELVQRRIDLVYSVALRRVGGDGHTAEDVVQVVFRDLASKAPKLCRHPMLTGWLFTSTRFAAEHASRATRRRRERETEAFEQKTVVADPSEAELNWSRLSPVVDQLLEGLSQRDRLAILLRYYENRPYAEIGQAMEASEDGARMRVQRALEKLRMKLEKQGIRSTPIALAALMADHAVAAAPAGIAAQVAATSAAVAGAAMPALLIPLMSTLKVTSVLTALAVLGAAGVLEWHEQSKLTAEYRELGLEREKLGEQERRVSRALAERTLAPIPAGIRGAGAGAPLTADAKGHRQNEEAIRKRYALFFRQHGLSEGQIERFIDLLNQQAEARTDLQEAVRKEGLADGPAVEAMRNDLNRPIVEGLRQLLGEDGYSALTPYDQVSFYEAAWVKPLEGYFSAENVPLDENETIQLTQIVAANDHPVKIAVSDLGTESAIDWGSVVTQAANVLTPAQLAVLQTQAQQLKIRQDQNIARLKAAAGTP